MLPSLPHDARVSKCDKLDSKMVMIENWLSKISDFYLFPSGSFFGESQGPPLQPDAHFNAGSQASRPKGYAVTLCYSLGILRKRELGLPAWVRGRS